MAAATGALPADYLDLGTGRSVPIRLVLDGQTLVITHPDGREIDRWPAGRVRPMPGDHAPPRFGADPDSLAVVAIADPEALAAFRQSLPTAAGPAHAPNRPARVGLWAGGALVSMLLIIFIVIPAFAQTLARFVPEPLERRIGEQVSAGLAMAITERGGKSRCATDDGIRALDRIVAQLHMPDAPPLTIRVVQSNMVNAAAMPGGHILIPTGMIEYAGSAEALAGVIAHEVGHVVYDHAMTRLMRSAMLGTLLSMVTGDIGFGISGSAVNTLLSAPYSQGQEWEADIYAADALAGAGVSLQPFAELFAKLRRDLGDEPGWSGLISTHPETRAREVALRDRPEPADPKRLLDQYQWGALRIICGKLAQPSLRPREDADKTPSTGTMDGSDGSGGRAAASPGLPGQWDLPSRFTSLKKRDFLSSISSW